VQALRLRRRPPGNGTPVSIWPSQPLHRTRIAAVFPERRDSEGRREVTGTSVLVIAPWAVFAASLVVLCLRIRKFRRR
jgi:hypothetical protein